MLDKLSEILGISSESLDQLLAAHPRKKAASPNRQRQWLRSPLPDQDNSANGRPEYHPQVRQPESH